MSRILIIEDDRDIADLISIHMEDKGHDATLNVHGDFFIESPAFTKVCRDDKPTAFFFYLDTIYKDLQRENNNLEVHLFEIGNHPAMLSNMRAFFELLKDKLNPPHTTI